MIEEAAGFGIQWNNGGHILRIERKINAAEILLHALLANCLGNNNDASLCQPTQDDLANARLMLFGQRQQDFVLEDVVFSLGKRSPSFDLNVIARRT